MDKTESLKNKLATIKRGAYWYGIFGRLCMFFGGLMIFFGILALVIRDPRWVKLFTTGLDAIIIGILTLMARTAFEAIEGLIREIGEIV